MRPLHGLRVLDLGIITAGAATSQLLRDMGAEVIKIESARYADPFREWIGRDLGGEGSPFFRATNRGKLGLGLDLKTDAGRAVFLRLAARCDVVVENFRRGVLDRLGLSFETLAAVNPKIVLASISSQGEFGPDAMQVSYGSTLEGVSGLAWLSGYADGAPEVSGVDFNYPDQVVATFASGMIVAALRDREQAVHLDLSQRELTSFLIGSAFTARALGETPARSGNADPAYPIQDCFRTLDARWLAVSVDAAHMDPLAGLLGTAPSTESLAGFVAHQQGTEARRALNALGIPAEIALNGVDLWQGQAFGSAILRGPGGAPVKGQPFRLSDPCAIDADAPGIGSHSRDILARIGGYDAAEIDALVAEGVVECAP